MDTHTIVPRPSLTNPGVSGVDMLADPLTLGGKLHAAVNLRFEEGALRTRPGFVYHRLNVSGQFQGSLHYSPSKGLSSRPFAAKNTALVVAVGGRLVMFDATTGWLSCAPTVLPGSYSFCDRGPVHLFQAENWMIVQNRSSNTLYWEGYGPLMESPGMGPCPTEPTAGCSTQKPGEPGFPGGGVPGTSLVPNFPTYPTDPSNGCADPNPVTVKGGPECLRVPDSTHDSFCSDRHVNWLINGAGLGIYAHGRVHQEGDGEIFVGDMVHKRGYLATDDVLKMEEAALDSMGDPLSVSSRLGDLKAMAVLPAMSSATGEGDLIAYYENGVVAFDTFKAPRQTRIDADGTVIQKGWSMERLVSHLLNTVSAVGRYAVALMPRDHFFRSVFGLHFLRTTIGDGSFNPEFLNSISQDVRPLLDADPSEALEGAATGVWVRGNRLLATVGMHLSAPHSPVGLGRGFVSFNLANTFTEDRTPRFTAEGVWVPDHEIEGIHRFSDLGLRPEQGTYGFLAADRDTELFFVSLNPDLDADLRDGDEVPIEWSFITGKRGWAHIRQKISEGIFSAEFAPGARAVRVSVRTDSCHDWTVWGEFVPRPSNAHGTVRKTMVLGQPPRACREAAWMQFKVEGLGPMANPEFVVHTEASGSNSGQSNWHEVSSCKDDAFQSNLQPISARWQTP